MKESRTKAYKLNKTTNGETTFNSTNNYGEKEYLKNMSKENISGSP